MDTKYGLDRELSDIIENLETTIMSRKNRIKDLTKSMRGTWEEIKELDDQLKMAKLLKEQRRFILDVKNGKLIVLKADTLEPVKIEWV